LILDKIWFYCYSLRTLTNCVVFLLFSNIKSTLIQPSFLLRLVNPILIFFIINTTLINIVRPKRKELITCVNIRIVNLVFSIRSPKLDIDPPWYNCVKTYSLYKANNEEYYLHLKRNYSFKWKRLF